jgi:hypothetical protein
MASGPFMWPASEAWARVRCAQITKPAVLPPWLSMSRKIICAASESTLKWSCSSRRTGECSRGASGVAEHPGPATCGNAPCRTRSLSLFCSPGARTFSDQALNFRFTDEQLYADLYGPTSPSYAFFRSVQMLIPSRRAASLTGTRSSVIFLSTFEALVGPRPYFTASSSTRLRLNCDSDNIAS